MDTRQHAVAELFSGYFAKTARTAWASSSASSTRTTVAVHQLPHPDLLIENCWNGGKPLDLQMIAHHDTTIGDDWCRSEQNRLAALGLGVSAMAGVTVGVVLAGQDRDDLSADALIAASVGGDDSADSLEEPAAL